MTEDILILHALRDRRRYRQLRSVVPESMLSPDTANILAWFGVYFQTYEADERVEVDKLDTLIRLRVDPNASAEAVAIVRAMVGKLAIEPNADAINGVQNILNELDLKGRAAALITRYEIGEEVDLAYELRALANDSVRQKQDGGVASWANADILSYLEQDKDEGGLIVDIFGNRLSSTLKGLRGADNVAVVAPTDKGKTSLLCKLAGSFGKQRAEDFASSMTDGRPILYLVNEGTAEAITPRMWQSVTCLDRPTMYARAQTGELQRQYADMLGGPDAIRMKNIHGKNLSQVEQIIEHHGPAVVFTDMTGRIKAVSNKSGAANDIGQLEEVWNHMRELAAIYNFLHMGTIQVSAEGFNMLYPPLSAMQNSKTGIQTTLDLCLMMGAIESIPDLRGISTPKNKRGRTGHNGRNEIEVTFNAALNEWSPN